MTELPPIMLMYAFRYALGRRSYCVGDVADALIANARDLTPDWRRQIIEDIEVAVANGNAGDETDVGRWQAVVRALQLMQPRPGF